MITERHFFGDKIIFMCVHTKTDLLPEDYIINACEMFGSWFVKSHELIKANQGDFISVKFDNKKETKMIDLSTAEVGDELVCSDGDIHEVKYIGAAALCTIKDGDLYLFWLNGVSAERSYPKDFVIESKHEPRHWLKDLPDAKRLNDGYFACDSDGSWYFHSDEPELTESQWSSGDESCTSMFKMPNLAGDEWKLSKISIADLKAWQEQNK